MGLLNDYDYEASSRDQAIQFQWGVRSRSSLTEIFANFVQCRLIFLF